MVRAVLDGRDAEKVFALALEIAVVQHGFVAAAARRADEHRVLAALAEADRVLIVPVRLGDRTVVFLDAAAHLLEKLVSQRLEVAGRFLVVCIFGLELQTDVIVEFRGIAQDFLPALVAHPCVVVDALLAVLLDLLRSLLGDRRLGGQHRKGLGQWVAHRVGGLFGGFVRGFGAATGNCQQRECGQ